MLGARLAPFFVWGGSLQMTSMTGGVTPRWKRVCIFVDGENFRHSLGDLFGGGGYSFKGGGGYSFKKEDCLPATWGVLIRY